MKSANQFACFASTALCLLAFASASLAATNPLNEPNGLAVGANGNLYVANTGANNIVVFNSKGKQITADTITEGINHPTAVAVDPIGHVWVANYGPGNNYVANISEYIGVVQDTNATLTEGVTSPLALAIDGLGDLWVQNGGHYLSVYAQPAIYSGGSVPTWKSTFIGPSTLYGIAVEQNSLALSAVGAFGVSFASALWTIETGSFIATNNFPYTIAVAIAGNGEGDFYIANLLGVVSIFHPDSTQSAFANLSFVPAGMAIDNVNGRVYFSNFQSNEILVYSMSTGQLVQTIK